MIRVSGSLTASPFVPLSKPRNKHIPALLSDRYDPRFSATVSDDATTKKGGATDSKVIRARMREIYDQCALCAVPFPQVERYPYVVIEKEDDFAVARDEVSVIQRPDTQTALVRKSDLAHVEGYRKVRDVTQYVHLPSAFKPTRDHIKPQVISNDDSMNNAILLCESCNEEGKGDVPLLEYLEGLDKGHIEYVLPEHRMFRDKDGPYYQKNGVVLVRSLESLQRDMGYREQGGIFSSTLIPLAQRAEEERLLRQEEGLRQQLKSLSRKRGGRQAVGNGKRRRKKKALVRKKLDDCILKLAALREQIYMAFDPNEFREEDAIYRHQLRVERHLKRVREELRHKKGKLKTQQQLRRKYFRLVEELLKFDNLSLKRREELQAEWEPHRIEVLEREMAVAGLSTQRWAQLNQEKQPLELRELERQMRRVGPESKKWPQLLIDWQDLQGSIVNAYSSSQGDRVPVEVAQRCYTYWIAAAEGKMALLASRPDYATSMALPHAMLRLENEWYMLQRELLETLFKDYGVLNRQDSPELHARMERFIDIDNNNAPGKNPRTLADLGIPDSDKEGLEIDPEDVTPDLNNPVRHVEAVQSGRYFVPHPFPHNAIAEQLAKLDRERSRLQLKIDEVNGKWRSPEEMGELDEKVRRLRKKQADHVETGGGKVGDPLHRKLERQVGDLLYQKRRNERLLTDRLEYEQQVTRVERKKAEYEAYAMSQQAFMCKVRARRRAFSDYLEGYVKQRVTTTDDKPWFPRALENLLFPVWGFGREKPRGHDPAQWFHRFNKMLKMLSRESPFRTSQQFTDIVRQDLDKTWGPLSPRKRALMEALRWNNWRERTDSIDELDHGMPAIQSARVM